MPRQDLPLGFGAGGPIRHVIEDYVQELYIYIYIYTHMYILYIIYKAIHIYIYIYMHDHINDTNTIIYNV